MLLDIFKLLRRKHAGSHVLVLDALVGQDSRSQTRLQVHMRQPLRVQPGNGVVAPPEGLQFPVGHPTQPSQQVPGILQKEGQIPPGQSVRVRDHLFGGGDDDPHGLRPR